MVSPAAPARRLSARGRRAPLLLVVPAAVGAAVAVLPLVYLADRARLQGAAAIAEELLQRRTFDLVTRSLTLVVAVTAACTVIGVTAALLVARTTLFGGRVWHVLLALPLAVPSYVAAYTWISARPSLAGLHGATLVLTLTSYPYVFLPVVAALRRLDPAQEEVARSFGLSPAAVVRRVILPAVRPAITAGALLVALYVLSDFGAVGMMRYEVFTWVIYSAYNAGFDPARAAILSLVLVVVALGVVSGEAASRGRGTAARVGAGAARAASPVRLGPLEVPALVFVIGLLAASLGFPLVSLGRSLVEGRGSVEIGELQTAVWASLRLSVWAALLTAALALPIGVLAARHRTRVAWVLERLSYVAHAMPGIAIAIAMVFIGVRLLEPIYQETPLLVLAYAVLFLPLAVGATRNAVEQSPPVLEEVGRSLGRGPLHVFRRVTARLASPGVAAGTAMVVLATMKELPVTLLLHPTGMKTLAMELWERTALSDYGGGAPFAAALVLVGAVPTAVLGWSTGRVGGVDVR